ncbi:hypothetical protein FRB94_008335 [Tulasnella sp. JGI-2019a]|nr:hypothetical protein FRB94_008335 [Tulasnella sp. JGI-2019a]
MHVREILLSLILLGQSHWALPTKGSTHSEGTKGGEDIPEGTPESAKEWLLHNLPTIVTLDSDGRLTLPELNPRNTSTSHAINLAEVALPTPWNNDNLSSRTHGREEEDAMSELTGAACTSSIQDDESCLEYGTPRLPTVQTSNSYLANPVPLRNDGYQDNESHRATQEPDLGGKGFIWPNEFARQFAEEAAPPTFADIERLFHGRKEGTPLSPQQRDAIRYLTSLRNPKLTQGEIAELCNVSQATVSQIARENRYMVHKRNIKPMSKARCSLSSLEIVINCFVFPLRATPGPGFKLDVRRETSHSFATLNSLDSFIHLPSY